MFNKMIDLLITQYNNLKHCPIYKGLGNNSNVSKFIDINWQNINLTIVEHPIYTQKSMLKLNISKIMPRIYGNILSSC